MLSSCPTDAADWLNKGCAMCYHAYVIMHEKASSRRRCKSVCRLMSIPLQPACAEQGNLYDSNEQTNKQQTKYLDMFVQVRHHIPVAGFCLPLYSQRMLNKDVSMIHSAYI